MSVSTRTENATRAYRLSDDIAGNRKSEDGPSVAHPALLSIALGFSVDNDLDF
jgi:hypothetical protein